VGSLLGHGPDLLSGIHCDGSALAAVTEDLMRPTVTLKTTLGSLKVKSRRVSKTQTLRYPLRLLLLPTRNPLPNQSRDRKRATTKPAVKPIFVESFVILWAETV
jgi:hypothetical protein